MWRPIDCKRFSFSKSFFHLRCAFKTEGRCVIVGGGCHKLYVLSENLSHQLQTVRLSNFAHCCLYHNERLFVGLDNTLEVYQYHRQHLTTVNRKGKQRQVHLTRTSTLSSENELFKGLRIMKVLNKDTLALITSRFRVVFLSLTSLEVLYVYPTEYPSPIKVFDVTYLEPIKD